MIYNFLNMQKDLGDFGIDFSDFEILLLEFVYRLLIDF